MKNPHLKIKKKIQKIKRKKMTLALLYHIIKYFFLILLIPIIVSLLYDLLCYLRYLTKYKSQGAKYVYKPLIGIVYLFLPPKNSKNGLEKWNNFFKSERNPLVLVNNPISPRPFISLTNADLIKDFFIHETEMSKREHFGKVFPLSRSFVFQDGIRALHLRSILLDILKASNMRTLAPMIKEKVDLMISDIKEKKTKNGEFVKVNMNGYFQDLFNDVISTILFGKNITEELRKIPSLAEEAIQAFENSANSPLSLITKGLITVWGLSPEAKKSKKLQKEVKRRLRNLCQERSDPGYPIGEDNILDLMIASNREAEADGKISDVVEIEEMILNIETVVFAGIDTSRNVSRACLHFITADGKIRKIIEEEVKRLEGENAKKEKNDRNDALKYDESEIFELLINEVLRVYNPAPGTFTRIITKDCKIGEYKFYKGDFISIPFASIHLDEAFFEKAEEINLNRKLDSKIRRTHFLPFGAGKRACVGRYLALLIIKIIIGRFVENFEFSDEGVDEAVWKIEMTFGIENCILNLKNKFD